MPPRKKGNKTPVPRVKPTIRKPQPTKRKLAKSLGPSKTSGRRPKQTLSRLHGFNAFNEKMHIPLPLSVGKYIVARTVVTFSSNRTAYLFGPNCDCIPTGTGATSITSGDWSTVIGRSINGSDSIAGATWTDYVAPLDLGSMAEVAPAAFSVRISNPGALQTTAGRIFAGRCTSTLGAPSSALVKTADTFMGQLLSYKAPSEMSASQLALNPVRIDAIPTDVSQLQRFTNLKEDAGGDNQRWAPLAGTFDTTNEFAGFAPIFVYNPDAVNLAFQVAVEWRVRLDPLNPMGGSARDQGMTQPNVWHDLIKSMEALGHGVVDAIEWVEGFV